MQRASPPPTFGRLGLVYVALTVTELSKVVSMVLSRLQKKTIGFFLLGLFLKNMYLHSSKEQTVFVKNLIFFMRNMKYQTLSSHVMYFTKESVKIGPLPWQ